MFSTFVNSLVGSTTATKNMSHEIAELRALKTEVYKARCVIEMDSAGNIMSVNQKMLDALDYAESDVLNQHHRALVGRTEAGSEDYQALWNDLAGNKVQTGEFKLQNKAGKDVWFQGYYAPILADGKLTKIVALLTDISSGYAESFTNKNDLARLGGALNSSSVAVMAIDRDFVVNYVNESTKALFTEYATEFRQAFPSFDPNKIMGTCIDVFHRNPQHQRTMLADPKNLPYTTVIKLGELSIRLHITASFDAAGNYSGNMLEWRNVTKEMSDAGQLAAINKSMGVISFDTKGNILDVNDNFATVTGYDKKDIIGKHHSMFAEPSYAASSAYKAFWDKLGSGEADAGQYKRIGKGGKEIWLEASYNPILDDKGKAFKVVKYATDITAAKLKNADFEGQLAAISKVMGVIEFDLKGNILAVNENFAAVTGYSEKEIVGNHHSMFADAAYKASHEYKAFWDRLGSGIADNGQYRRVGKGGKEIWLQASYNPIFDASGKPYKVVKYATDITEQYNAAQSLAKAVEESQEVIQQAKTGDLTSRVSLEGKTGAVSTLCDGINALIDKMTEVVMQVKEAGETINTAAGEIATGNNDLSSRTEQQASSLEETASSMEELASTVKQNAENAKQANQLAAAASGVAVKGGEVVGQVVTTMDAINSSAKKIEDIISVIDGIAFQTNILALNAAVEAARAGEQGRGFAVVAGEVRNLAQRSASAAKEIKELITDSVSKTAEGTAQVENAGKTMQEIVSSVQRVTDIMGEISAASSEQSTGIDQVNTAITSMDEVTQQNAALVEQAAAAAESLVEQAATLMETVNEFKLTGGTSNERRATGSAMRSNAGRPSSRPAAKAPTKQVTAKVLAKTGTDDGDWEEF